MFSHSGHLQEEKEIIDNLSDLFLSSVKLNFK